MSVICDVIVIFQCVANLEQSGSRILNACSVILTFSLTVPFYFTETGNNQKNLSNTAVILLLCVKVLISETTYVCTYVPKKALLS